VKAEPQQLDLFTGIGINAINPRGLGTESPEKRFSLSVDSFRSFRSFPDSILSSEACLRPQLLHEPIPLNGVAIIIQPQWASRLAALTRALTKEPVAAGPAARDIPPAW